MKGYRTLHVVGFAIDADGQRPIALLKDSEGEATFPLWLTAADVVAISAELITRELGRGSERKDLLASVLDGLGLAAESVILDGELSDGYRTVVRLSGANGIIDVPLQPAAALAASLKYSLPVEVSEESINKSILVDMRVEDQPSEKAGANLKEILEKLNPAEMGKFPM